MGYGYCLLHPTAKRNSSLAVHWVSVLIKCRNAVLKKSDKEFFALLNIIME